MVPTPWTAFTFFGIPLVLGVLGGTHGARLLWRAYGRYVLERVDDGAATRGDGLAGERPAYSLEEQVGRGLVLLVGSAVLLAHSGRWLLSVYGYL
jgi:hypothetical protein